MGDAVGDNRIDHRISSQRLTLHAFMTTPKEITATEKLLDLIRASSPGPESNHHQETESDHHPPTPPERSGMEREFAFGTDLTSHAKLEALRPDADEVPVIVLSASDDDDAFPPAATTPKIIPEVAPIDPLSMVPPEIDDFPVVMLSANDEDNPPPPSAAEKELAPPPTVPPLEMHRPELEDTSPLALTTESQDDDDEPPPPSAEKEPVALAPLTVTELEMHRPGAEIPSLLSADDDDDPLPSVEGDVEEVDEEDQDGDSVSALLAMQRPPSFTQRASATISTALHRLRPSSKTIIAIDIQPGMIHLVKTRSSKGGHHLQECQSVPYDYKVESQPDPPYTDQEFMKVLFRTISNFIPTHGHHEIWCSYAFCNPVALHNITIPKVADKEVANAVFWSAKRELELDETTTLFDFAILQELTENSQPRIQTLVTLVPQEELAGITEMFKSAGFPLTGLTFPAAAIQNFLNHDPSIPADSPVVYFTIRRNSSFIDIFHQGKMFFSREIKTGTDSFIESLLELALQQNIIIDEESAKDYLFRPRDDSGDSVDVYNELSTQFNFDGLAVIERLVRQLVRTFEYCATTFKTPPVSRIFTSGEYTVNAPILQAIENRIGIKCQVLDPFASTIFHRDQQTRAPYASELMVAAGLSLSEKGITTNFLFTYKEQALEKSTNRINTIIAMVTICLALGVGGFFAWQYRAELGKEATIAAMRSELNQLYQQEPLSRSDEYTTRTIGKIEQFHHDNRERLIRFKVLALINELTQQIGPELRITDLTLDLMQKQTDSRLNKDATSPSPPGTVLFAGYISAPPEAQEFILMNLLKSLATLNLLGDPKLKSTTRTSLQNHKVLRFEITLKTTFAFLETPAT